MSYPGRFAICVAVSVTAHVLLARGSAHLPPRVEAAPAVVLRVELREQPLPEPEPEPEPEATAPKPQAKPPVHEAPTRRSQRASVEAPVAVNAPKQSSPTERPATVDTGAAPVFGISMESTSSAGSGPSLPVGNTLQARPNGHAGEGEAAARPVVAPVPAYEVTKMPLPRGECQGKYTDEAREAGLEGVVIFDLVVDEHGRVCDLSVVQALGGGLTEAAKRALQACSFSPGERDGKAVPVRVRSFKIRFRLRDDE